MIRRLELKDIAPICRYVKNWQTSLPEVQVKPFDTEYCIEVYTTLYKQGYLVAYLVVADNHRPVGLIAGIITPGLEHPDLEAREIHFFVEEAYRGFSTANRLLRQFRGECIARGATKIYMGGGIGSALHKLYTRAGFIHQPPSYLLEV